MELGGFLAILGATAAMPGRRQRSGVKQNGSGCTGALSDCENKSNASHEAHQLVVDVNIDDSIDLM